MNVSQSDSTGFTQLLTHNVFAISCTYSIACQNGKNTELLNHDFNCGLQKSHIEGMDDLHENYIQDFYQVGISSISDMSDPYKKCPVNWKMAMKNHDAALWREALYTHLVKCYNMGTYGIPQVAPSGARVIAPVRTLNC